MSSSNIINQKEYLKKYLGVGKTPGEKKKKKKKEKSFGTRLTVIDDNIDDYNISKEIQVDIEAADEDAPQIVAVIDERPPSLRIDEKTNSLLWKPIGENDDIKIEASLKVNSFQLKKLTLDSKSDIKSESSSSSLLNTKYDKTQKSVDRQQKTYEGRYIKKKDDYSPRKSEKRRNRDEEHPLERSKQLGSSGNCDRKNDSSSDGDTSPPRKSSKHHSFSPSKKSKQSDSREKRESPSCTIEKDVGNTSQHPIKKEHGSDSEYHSAAQVNESTSEEHSSKDRNVLTSPLRKIKREYSDSDTSPPRRKQDSSPRHNSTRSPIRKTVRYSSSDEDMSPPRKRPEAKDLNSKRSKKRYTDSDGDVSPPRKQVVRYDSQEAKYVDSKKSKRRYTDSDGDFSPPRKQVVRYNSHEAKDVDSKKLKKRSTDSDSDVSPPRRVNRNVSPPRKYDDISPPRNKSHGNKNSSPQRKNDDLSPRRKKRRSEDISPPRKKSDPKKSHKDENISPPRRNKLHSPTRRLKSERRSTSPDQRKREHPTHSRWGDWSTDHKEPKSSRKPEKTMSGKKAGLQNAREIGKELASLRKKEDQVFQNMSEDVSGRNAATVVRHQKQVDPEEEARKFKKEKEMKEKYDRWGKGLKQVETETQKMADQLYEMSKPLARYADDEDLEKYLKDQEREGDPMLAYIRKKKKKKKFEAGRPEKPMYMGEFMPNRFGIPPGYRWDGVDRSNGYETKWFEKLNARKAIQEEVLKWSTEDM